MNIKYLYAKLNGCRPDKLADEKVLVRLLDDISSEINVHVVKRMSHYYGPGVSVVFLLAESHISVHTWPELGFADFEIVSCTGNSDVNKGLEMAAKALGATKVDKQISEYKQNVPVINIRKRRESKI
ncbi:MAG TPA: adenosylmethionine decarboxylase [Nanoarchaeota archaeon]|nr:MAG: S-adenosylmethionine decarboxylase [archaeon GW2011_AR6]MBS3082533.1 adenosylmethionine decarboxylase [Candidatus Pacearchaeota archaeon]HIH17362.1 adenosylmethionine decarboxylase [Nanoarchaeota archaeon]HIH33911.1 adenosylmethionine decarboxylase [Nanoarchaeota archaeon]HIH51116.1 adenosylmethionine decarboxylase [Nanoarchaeota archaeon]